MAMQNLEYMGLAEFVAKLIGETFEAVLSSHEDQEMQRNEILSLMETDEETFAENFVSDDEINAFLSDLFPSDGQYDLHEIVENAEYLPEDYDKKIAENPPLKKYLGILFKEKIDYIDNKITRQGVGHVYDLVSLQIAKKRLHCLQKMAQKGFPRIIVDSGKILAKVSFKIEESVDPDSTSNTPDLSLSSGTRLEKKASLYRLHKRILPHTKMMIKQAREVDSGSTSSLYGEVEIKFRVI